MLKGKAKTDYMREYMRRKRSNKETVRPIVLDLVRPGTVYRDIPNPVQPNVPLYNSSKHKAGDTVILQGKIVTIPELDGDGNIVPGY